ncbi:MAG: homoprotocatechuate degradation operon regulator HpaR [Steroidobacteraceae bacterium]
MPRSSALRVAPLKAAAAVRPQPPMRPFTDSLPMALLKARESVMRRFRPGLRAHAVTEQQWRVLRALSGLGPLEITELAARTCLLPPSLSRILPSLESRGLVVRRGVVADLRRTAVSVTAAGLALIAAHAPQSEGVYRAIEERFGAERLGQLSRLLDELEAALAPPAARGHTVR